MDEKLSFAIKEYQCSGCMSGYNLECFQQNDVQGVGCGKHYAGTGITHIGKIFLGLPRGFNRLGEQKDLKPIIFDTFDDKYYNMFNVPVWKHLDEHGNTLVRGMMPRRNEPFIHIYIGNHIDKINCLEITKQDIEEMD
jgi:hypothetical protein